MARIIITLSCLLVLTGCDQATPLRLTESSAQTAASLESALPELMRKNAVSGIGVAVIRNGKATLVKSIGVANDTMQSSIKPDTIFEVASLGKPVFAYLALRLADDGLFNLDVPLTQYVPGLFSAPDPRLQAITARMVLSHSSGLPNFGSDHPEQLEFDPGVAYQYSGIGFERLQRVLEVLSGKSLNELAQTIVFEPLGMTSTSYIWREEYRPRFALGHDGKGNQLNQARKPDRGNAAWSLYSTPADYAKFVERQLRHDDPVTAAMTDPQIKITDEISWGVGWSLQSTKPNSSFWHWGSNPGYRGYVVGYPTEGIAVIVLSNSETMFKLVEPVIQMTIGGGLPSYHWF